MLYELTDSGENTRVNTWGRFAIGWIVLIAAAAQLFAGGSGLNVVVVVNQNSSDSVELGNYYCERREVPPQNVLRINWTGGNVDWSQSDFDTHLRIPLISMLSSRQLTNQIDYILLSMNIPYRVGNANGDVNGTTSALYYGFKPNAHAPDVCLLAGGSASAYAGSEGIFRQTPPISASSNSWLVMMLTSSNLTQARLIVDRGVLSDGSFPTQKVFLIKNTDTARNVRYAQFDDSVFDNRIRELAEVERVDLGFLNFSPAFLGHQLGSQFGLVNVGNLPANLFAPGGLGDILTSYCGFMFENAGHTHVLDYLNAGAAASYGTVLEPCNYLEKFASPRNYFYQARGFSAAECYYLSVTNPYEGVLVGEPLAAPFAAPATGAWTGLPSGAALAGTTNLSVQFNGSDTQRRIQQVDLFLDGTFLQTITNLPPRQNNILYVTLPGRTNMSYLVPAGATLQSVANGVAAVLNSPANNNVTRVSAFTRGDRLELRSTDANRTAENTFVSVSNHVGSASALTTFLNSSRSSFLASLARGLRGFNIAGTVILNDTLSLTATKTNGSQVVVSVTNTSIGVTLDQFVGQFINAINATVDLQGLDGLIAEDQVPGLPGTVDFNLRARGEGFPAAQIQAAVGGTFLITPVGTQRLNEHLGDLQPRNHLYVLAGLTNLPLTFGFNTTTQADGYHELTAVAYEGSHVRTQRRIAQSVRIQNTTLSATFASLLGGTNAALEATLQFSVVANTSNITRIELFGTGGPLANVTSQSSALFPVVATNLGIGLHPFYALVTRADGKQYRTETKWIRLVGPEPPFALSLAGPAPRLEWPATAGRRYEVLSSTNLAATFLLRDALTPSNSAAQWSETNNSSPQRLYRVRVAE